MSSVHVFPRFAQISRTFADSDRGALMALAIAVATLGLIAVYLFN